MKKEQFNVTGMTCAACSARVEKAVGKLPGVDKIAVNLLKNSNGLFLMPRQELAINSRALCSVVSVMVLPPSRRAISRTFAFSSSSSTEVKVASLLLCLKMR